MKITLILEQVYGFVKIYRLFIYVDYNSLYVCYFSKAGSLHDNGQEALARYKNISTELLIPRW